MRSYDNLMRILGFIPARSGSKRLKNKNLKKFLVENKTFLFKQFKQKGNKIDIDNLEDFKICEFRIKNNLLH